MYIRESIELIGQYTHGGSSRPMPRTAERDAVIHRLETLGDAAGHLSAPLRERHPDIPWEAITGFRNRLAHGYMSIRFDLVWEAIERGIPELGVVVDEELGRARDDTA